MTQAIDPELLGLFQAIGSELLSYTPEKFRTAFCVATQAPGHGEGRLRYDIGSRDFPDEGTDRPSPELHEAVHAVCRYYRRKNEAFPGLDARIEVQPDGRVRSSVSLVNLDAKRPTNEDEEAAWQAVYTARERAFEQHIGAFPGEIMKLMNLTGVWPGGGLFQLEGTRIGGAAVCTSFGLTNADMPTSARAENATQSSEEGKMTFSATLAARTPRWVPPDLAGYGYEIMILTPAVERWPMVVVGWFVQMEILKDIDLLDRVNEMGGVTVEDLSLGDGRHADFLVAPARAPLPERIQLPNGTARLLVATRITRDEMKRGMEEGREQLAEMLAARGVGQVSVLDRPSILR